MNSSDERADRAQLAERDVLGRTGRTALVQAPLRLDLRVAGRRVHVDADLVPAEAEQAALVLAERDEPA